MKKKGLIAVVAALIVLAAAIVILVMLNKPEEVSSVGGIRVMWGDSSKEFTMDEMKAMAYVTVEKEVSGKKGTESGEFRGVSLRTLLENCGISTEGLSTAAVQSEDGYVTAFDIGEILASDDIFLAYALDGKPLESAENGGSGPYRIVVTGDEFATRCARNVCSVEFS